MRFLYLSCLFLALTACEASSPKAKFLSLQQTAIACQAKAPLSDSCLREIKKLQAIESQAYMLRASPQQFGLDVISLQNDLAKLETQIKKKSLDASKKNSLSKKIVALKTQLNLKLWVIALFESPAA